MSVWMHHRTKATRFWPVAITIAVTAAMVHDVRGQGDANQIMTPAMIAKLRSAASPRISADGKWIAYVQYVQRRPLEDDSGPSWAELHVVDQDGRARGYVTGEVNVSHVDWSPDGRDVTYTAKRGKDKKPALYAIAIDGGESRAILRHDTGVGDYSWSPDGAAVAFLATEKEKDAEKKLKDKGFDAIVYEEKLDPTRVWIGTPNADDPDAKSRMLDLPGSALSVAWSPAGDALLVVLSPTPLVDDEIMNAKYHIVDPATGEVRRKIETPGKIGKAAWSPDGKSIAFIGAEDRNDPGEGRLFVMSASDGAPNDILPDYPGHVTDLAWQDNETMMYLVDEGVWTSFARIGSDGGSKKTLIPTGKHVIRSFSLAKTGMHAAFAIDSAAHPTDIFAMNHGQTEPRRLTDSNPWLADVRMAKQEPIRYKARDGVEIEGILYHPLDEKTGQRYPLIIAVHGGPEAHEPNGWRTDYSRPGQLAAARGFAVLYPNYRGSTGRGVAFSKLDQADYAGAEFDDLVDGIDHLVKMGLVDRARVGVTGGSYGGFASAWCATKLTDHFAASVMFVGISDHVSKFGTTDIPQEMYEVHARKWPWDDWEFFRERSPITHTPGARTPTLIMHGQDDTRVHPSQSMELYRYLKVLGNTPVRLVFFPGEGHGNRKSASRLDYCLRMMRWMEHYLQGPGGEPPAYELDYRAALGMAPEKAEEDQSKDGSKE